LQDGWEHLVEELRVAVGVVPAVLKTDSEWHDSCSVEAFVEWECGDVVLDNASSGPDEDSPASEGEPLLQDHADHKGLKAVAAVVVVVCLRDDDSSLGFDLPGLDQAHELST